MQKAAEQGDAETYMTGLKLSRLIACGLLLLAIANLPYGYYIFLRIAITIIAGINAFSVYKRKNKTLFAVFLGIAVLFNPLVPIYLDKGTWILIDLIVGLFFGVAAFMNFEASKQPKVK